MSEPNPAIDRSCLAIADYLMKRLNITLQQDYPNAIAVRDIVSYDAVNPDLSRFPLLKVYRLTDTYDLYSNETDAVIAYCLTFPNQEQLPGILRWASYQIVSALRDFSVSQETCPGLRFSIEQVLKAEYRVMVNEVANPVYAFLRVNFQFKEN